MPQSLATVYLHVVFSTKHREPLITPDLALDLYPYLGGIARGNKNVLLNVGGMPDHVHLLISMGREQSIAELVGTLKAGSSRWIHDTFPARKLFAWQAGYRAFSIGRSELETVRHYVDNQAEHHLNRTFQDEYRVFLREYEVNFDERYVWD